MRKPFAFLFCLLLAASALHAVDIKLGHVGALVSPANHIATIFKEKVEAKTGGAVTVTIFDSGTLGNEKSLQEGVRSGSVDMAIAGTFHNVLPWAGILESPLLFRDMEHFIDVFTGSVGEKLIGMVQSQTPMKTIFVAPHGGFRYITTKVTPIKKPEDMNGLKLRNPNVPSFNIMAQAVGAIAVPLDFAELYLALDRGVVQGQHNPTLQIIGSKLYEVQDYFVMIPWGISPHVVNMSARMWNRLTAEQRQAVMEAGEETAREYPVQAREEEEKWLKVIEENMTIIRPEEIDMEAFSRIFREKGLPALEKEYGKEAADLLRAIIE